MAARKRATRTIHGSDSGTNLYAERTNNGSFERIMREDERDMWDDDDE